MRTVDLEKKEAYDSNNARNRDLYGFAKVNNLLNFDSTSSNDIGHDRGGKNGRPTDFDKKNDQMRSSNPQEVENALISYIDERQARANARQKKPKK